MAEAKHCWRSYIFTKCYKKIIYHLHLQKYTRRSLDYGKQSIHFLRQAMKLPLKYWVIGIKGFLAFPKTNNEAAYRKYSMHDPKWSCYTQTALDFHFRNCQTEAKENAYMKIKLGSRGSAWTTNMNFDSPSNGSNTTTLTERDLKASNKLFFLIFLNDLNCYYHVSLLYYRST